MVAPRNPEPPSVTADRPATTSSSRTALAAARAVTLARPGARLLLLAALLLAALLVSGAYLALRDYRASRARTSADTRLLARGAAVNANRFLTDRLELLAVVAHAPVVRSGNRQRILGYLESLHPASIGFNARLGFVDRDGRAQVLTGYALSAPVLDVSNRGYIRSVLETHRPAISAAFVGRIAGTPQIALASPVLDDTGRFSGMVIGSFRLDQADESVQILRFGSTNVTILDRSSQQIVTRAPVTQLRKPPNSGLIARSRRTRDGVLVDVASLDGRPGRLVAFAHTTPGGWTIFVERSTSEAFGPAKRALAFELGGILLALLIGSASAVLLAGRLNRVHDQQLQLVMQERHARELAESEEARSRLLAEAALALDQPGALGDRLTRVLALCVPELADSARVEAIDDSATVRVLATAGDAEQPSELISEHAIVAAIQSGGRSAGTLTLARLDPDRVFSRADRQLADGLAARIAVAIASAQAFDEQRQIARSLQRNLLAGVSEDSESRLSVAVRYESATRALEIGGDWYDTFPLADGRIAAIVGDVVGHGLVAASAMGTLRSGLRAIALTVSSPGQLLAQLDRFAERTPNAHFTTVVCAVIDPEAHVLTYAAAGHPFPLLVDRSGVARFLEGGRSLPLAGLGAAGRVEETVAFEPGSTLLLYTDGLVERRGEPIDERMSRLLAIASAMSGEAIEEVADEILEQLLGDEPRRDDVALLCLSLPQALPRFLRHRPASADQLAPLRRDLRAWLESSGVAAATAADIVLAVGEACANAVLHAYGADLDGSIKVEGTVANREVRLVVHDSGRWKPKRARTGGRGYAIMRATMSDVRVVARATGTTVSLRRKLDA